MGKARMASNGGRPKEAKAEIRKSGFLPSACANGAQRWSYSDLPILALLANGAGIGARFLILKYSSHLLCFMFPSLRTSLFPPILPIFDKINSSAFP